MLSELFDLLLLPFTWFLQRRLTEAEIRAFYKSPEWKRLRYAALARHGRRCLCCGASPATGARIVVDHIKPVRTHPHLRLRLSNLQPLCDACNTGKGSRDRTDWRPSR
jgi:5-methylcytosine-specific restriction endonuclease McrA